MKQFDAINFSLWCDFVERDFLNDAFVDLIDARTIEGATSNPAIFKSAFLGSAAYAEDKKALQGKPAKEVYENLAVTDIAIAATRLNALFVQGRDGFISIEVDPTLSRDARGTLEEGKRLYASINKPNVMIKVPATTQGYEAMEELMALGINVNATLIFSIEQARQCKAAMARGLDRCTSERLPQAVISVFVSRFDRKVDATLINAGVKPSLVGIYNAIRIYKMIEENPRKEIRTLFASTGVKGDTLSADYYISELLLPNAVNTAPLATINAYLKNVVFNEAPLVSDETIDAYFAEVKHAGIDMDKVNAELMHEGLVQFEEAFEEIMVSLKG